MAKLSLEDLEYRRENHSVSLINYHMIIVPKRRKPVLVGNVAKRLQEILFEVVVERGWRLIAQEVMPDHLHYLVNVPPTHSASQVAKWVKGRASHHLRKEFPHLLKLATLWSPSYFAGSVGNVSTETVKRSVESQRGK